ncbi:SDR family oxidoreductase [Ruania halotolerans]|uniref:SDR family oxidoreductase n=1 Tax=Ruania halotolerans TaxID=2897773 RepID=UPI001E584E92|nr:SDR family oxidoreductase [Ruania halotolerans]UFU06920.1 SDR family oxidoreductase [Ruania halotolerans]
MTIAVTGASGHLGRLTVRALLNRGVPAGEIVATARNTESIADLAGLGVRTVAADYDDPTSLPPALAGVRTLLLVSGSAVGQRVRQHGAVIDAAVAAGVERIVYTSAPHADTSALVLAPEHKATEELLAAAPIATTILRNSWYTENYADAVARADQTGEIVASVGEGRVASASRQDYAEAAAAVLTTDGHADAIYELTGDLAWTHEDLAKAASAVVGREVTFRNVTPAEHEAMLREAGLDEGTAGFVVALDQNIKAGLLAEVTDDLSRLIGRPTTPLIDGLRATMG